MKAIRAKCLDCSCNQTKEVRYEGGSLVPSSVVPPLALPDGEKTTRRRGSTQHAGGSEQWLLMRGVD